MLFEIYSQRTELDKASWFKFISKIYSSINFIDSFKLDLFIGESAIDFFISSAKDLSQLSSDLSPFILKAEDIPILNIYKQPENPKKFFWFTINTGEDILKIRDREEFRNNRKLIKVEMLFKKIFIYQYCIVRFYFWNGSRFQVKKKKYTDLNIVVNLLCVDFSKSVNYKKKTVPLFLKLQKVSHLFSNLKEGSLLEILGFPYLKNQNYFPLKNMEFDKHSLIVGQTGTGKSKYIELFVREMIKDKNSEYAIIVLDPHAALYSDFLTKSYNIDFFRNACSLFPSNADPKIATELTIMLFKTLTKDQFNPKMERVLKYSLFVLYVTKSMSLLTLRKFLSEMEFRKSIIKKLPKGSEQQVEFFDTDFIELQTKFYEMSIMPILVLLDELSFLPITNLNEAPALEKFVLQSPLTFLSLNKMLLGEKATKLLAGLLIQQIFMLAQSKIFKKKIIFIIDEVSIIENEALSSILSEARKFNLSLFLTQQYLTQVAPDLLKSIVTNVFNYFVFKVSEEDARLLAKNLEMEFSDEIVKDGKDKGLKEEDLKVKMITSLNPRECLTRIYANNQFYPCFKSKTVDI